MHYLNLLKTNKVIAPNQKTLKIYILINERTILDLKTIKQVIDLMKRSELTEFEFEEDGFKLRQQSIEFSNGTDHSKCCTGQSSSSSACPAPGAPAPSAGKKSRRS